VWMQFALSEDVGFCLRFQFLLRIIIIFFIPFEFWCSNM
jgi:hypothetical protein